MTRREALKAKIAALRAKTRGAGCTEAEAIAAAELAARLMADHGWSEADVLMGEASTAREPASATWRTKLSAVIAYCTSTSSIAVRDGSQAKTLFVGLAPGPEIAAYLRDVCVRAVATELRAFKAASFYRRRRTLATRRQAAADFVEGLVDRLCVRLIELFEPTRDEQAYSEARSALQARFKNTVAHTQPKRETRFSAAASAGWVAGGRVGLHRGVGEQAAPRALGKASE